MEKDIVLKKCKRRLKKKNFFLLVLFFIIIVGGGITFYKLKKDSDKRKVEEEKERLVEVINNHYNKYVKVNKDTLLYDDSMKEIGKVYQDEELILEDINIDSLTKYFKVKDLGLISYLDVSPIDNLKTNDERYKNYLPFNKNIITKDKFTLYDEDKKVITLNKETEFPIIINDYKDRYYVEYNNRLLSIKKDDVKEIVDSKNTDKKNAAKVTTFCYHRIYDETIKCNDIYVCRKQKDFDNEMKYLKDNNYFTFTMEEMYLYLTSKLQVEKAVLVTLDDGWHVKGAIEVFEKYGLNGTSFIKTKVWDDLSSFASPNLEVHSHTHDMHTPGVCKKEQSYQQGGGILCLSEDKIMEDLTTSREKLNGAIALAYPFYDYNTRAMKLVEKAGFKMAFIGAGGVKGKSYPGINLYKIPRMTIWDTTTFSTWKSYL